MKKYVELIEKTKGMRHTEIVEFLADWNKKHFDNKVIPFYVKQKLNMNNLVKIHFYQKRI